LFRHETDAFFHSNNRHFILAAWFARSFSWVAAGAYRERAPAF
jgi:hypothetical protein